jgi:hypothetical protein
MKGNCAKDSRLAFNLKSNNAKGGNLCQRGARLPQRAPCSGVASAQTEAISAAEDNFTEEVEVAKLGWDIRLEFRGIPQLIQFQTF